MYSRNGKSKIVTNIDDNSYVVFANSLIEARYKMSLNESKIYIAIISLIDKEAQGLEIYQVDVKTLKDILNSDDLNIYDDVKQTVRKLASRIIEIENKEARDWRAIPIWSELRYKNGVLYAEFSDKIKPYLYLLKKDFTSFILKEFKPFTSKYSIRMYQLLKQYQSIGERIFKIDDLRLKLGIENSKLKNFAYFRKYVLDMSQKELDNTPMAFDWEISKKGKSNKILEIKFILKNRNPNRKFKNIDKDDDFVTQLLTKKEDDLVLHEITDNKTLFQKFKMLYKLIPHQYKTKALDSLLAKYVQEKGYLYVKQNIEYVLNQKNVKNFMLYLTKAFEKDYGYATTSEIDTRIKQDDAKMFFEAVKNIDLEYKNTIFRVFSCRYDTEKQEFILECRKVEDPEHGVMLGAPSIEFLQKGIHWLGVVNIENLL